MFYKQFNLKFKEDIIIKINLCGKQFRISKIRLDNLQVKHSHFIRGSRTTFVRFSIYLTYYLGDRGQNLAIRQPNPKRN